MTMLCNVTDTLLLMTKVVAALTASLSVLPLLFPSRTTRVLLPLVDATMAGGIENEENLLFCKSKITFALRSACTAEAFESSLLLPACDASINIA